MLIHQDTLISPRLLIQKILICSAWSRWKFFYYCTKCIYHFTPKWITKYSIWNLILMHVINTRVWHYFYPESWCLYSKMGDSCAVGNKHPPTFFPHTPIMGQYGYSRWEAGRRVWPYFIIPTHCPYWIF